MSIFYFLKLGKSGWLVVESLILAKHTILAVFKDSRMIKLVNFLKNNYNEWEIRKCPLNSNNKSIYSCSCFYMIDVMRFKSINI